ncbi:hypothetical protein ONZ45_g6303 [Pleurotus djamor]|nr:hypothetical protein ONZ45_g6303 [Pleurotus djamor]
MSNLFSAPASNTTSGTSSTPSNIFGNLGKPANAGTTTPSLFGGGGRSSTNASTPASKPPLFGGFGAPSTPASSTPLFGGSTTTQPSTTTPASQPGLAPSLSTKPAESTTPKPAMPNFFGQPAAAASTTTSTTPAPGGLFSFAKPPEPTSSSQPASSSTPAAPAAPTASLFGGGNLFGKPAAPASDATPGTTAPAGGLFAGLGTSNTSDKEKKDAAPSLNLFAKPADKPAAPAAPAVAATLGGDKPKEVPSVALTTPASTTTPSNASAAIAVPPPSMLRGKTIEEIINRWTSELETHVRDFNRFAGEVAVWDRALIDNGKNLATLFTHVTAVEREQSEIEQSLDHIEQQQKDLSSTLDSYEKAMQDVLGGQGGSLRALDTGPADSERDKNYMLATDLHMQLDDLSGSLTQMIESVNGLSLTNGPKEGAAEDPMSQISQILSSHLESLQWIDGAVKEVESKISEVETRVKDSGVSLTGASSGPAKSKSFGLR